MKKTIIVIIVLVFAALATFYAYNFYHNGNDSENGEGNDENVVLSVATLKGPTGMGMAKLINDKPSYADISLYGSADEIKSMLITESVDIAAIPANLASVIYNKTGGKYRIAAINTLGVLYVVERGENIKSISDLNGKTVYMSGQGSTPEYILNHILEKNSVTPSEIVFKSEQSELATLLLSGSIDVAVLPEPFVSTVMSKSSDLRVALSLNDEWQKSCEGSIVQGVIVISEKAIKEYPKTVEKFLFDYRYSVDFVNGSKEKAAKMISEIGIVPSAEIAENAIYGSNIVFIDGENMKNDLNAFFSVLYGFAPQSIGGAMPDDNIYYVKKGNQ